MPNNRFTKVVGNISAFQIPAAADGVSYSVELTVTTQGVDVVTTAADGDWVVQDDEDAISIMTDAAFTAAYEPEPGLGSAHDVGETV